MSVKEKVREGGAEDTEREEEREGERGRRGSHEKRGRVPEYHQ